MKFSLYCRVFVLCVAHVYELIMQVWICIYNRVRQRVYCVHYTHHVAWCECAWKFQVVTVEWHNCEFVDPLFSMGISVDQCRWNSTYLIIICDFYAYTYSDSSFLLLLCGKSVLCMSTTCQNSCLCVCARGGNIVTYLSEGYGNVLWICAINTIIILAQRPRQKKKKKITILKLLARRHNTYFHRLFINVYINKAELPSH